MNKVKIFKIVLIGNLFISLPFIVFILYYYNVDFNQNSDILFLAAIIGFFYWSFSIPIYKLYSIKKLKNKQEYFYWNQLSVNSLLFWPDNFLLTKFEFWNGAKWYDFQERKNELFLID